MFAPHFVYLFVDERLDYLYTLTLVSNAAVNVRAHISLWDPAFDSSACRYASGIAASRHFILQTI